MLISVANSREGRAQLSRRIHPFIDWLSPHIEMGGEGGGGKGGGEREREKELTSHLRVCGVETGWPFDFIRFLEFRFDYGLEIRKLESGFLHQGPTGTTNSTKKRKKERKKEGKKERKREKSHPMNSHANELGT